MTQVPRWHPRRRDMRELEGAIPGRDASGRSPVDRADEAENRHAAGRWPGSPSQGQGSETRAPVRGPRHDGHLRGVRVDHRSAR